MFQAPRHPRNALSWRQSCKVPKHTVKRTDARKMQRHANLCSKMSPGQIVFMPGEDAGLKQPAIRTQIR